MLDQQTEPPNQQDTVRQSPKSEHSSSPISETGSLPSESYYASLLKQIPGFETYSYNSSPSTNHGGTALTRASKFDHHKLRLLDASSSPPHFIARNDRVGIDELTYVIPQINDISRREKLLLRLEFKVEAIHRKLNRTRVQLMQELDNGDKMLEQDFGNDEDSRRKWRHHSERLRKWNQQLRSGEEEVEPLQYDLTQARFEIINLYDALHAFLTGGTKPGDSDVSYEDRWFENFGEPIAPGLLVDMEANGGEPYPVKALEEVRKISQDLTTTVQNFDDEDGVQAAADDKPSKAPSGEERARSPHLRHHNTEAYANGVHDDKGQRKRIVINREDLAFCGTHLNQVSTTTHGDDTAQMLQLVMEPTLVSIRKNDLQGILGYPLQDLDNDLKLIGNLTQTVNIGVAQKLSQTSLPSVHTRQMISLWTTAMSQNSILEASRTLLHSVEAHDEHAQQVLGQLSSIRAYSRVLLQLVQDVRHLEVPLDAKIDDPYITLNREQGILDDDISRKAQPASTPGS